MYTKLKSDLVEIKFAIFKSDLLLNNFENTEG